MRHAVILACLVSSTASADDDPTPEQRLAELRTHGQVYTDGKHFIAFAPIERHSNTLTPHLVAYYGDAKTLAPIRMFANEVTRDGDDNIVADRLDIEDRRFLNVKGELDHNDLTIRCDKRTTKYRGVPAGMKTFEKTTFALQQVFSRREYLLARDDGTTYYYVDQDVDRQNDFRLYTGKRGALKQMAIKDMASDAAGDVLVTPTGTLHVNRKATANAIDMTTNWTPTGKKPIDLTLVPAATYWIFNDLGVYAGRRFGTPCDDL